MRFEASWSPTPTSVGVAVCVTALSVSAQSVEIAAPGAAVSEYGHNTVTLVESHLCDPNGRPYEGPDAWPLLQEIVTLARESIPASSTEADPVPLVMEILYRKRSEDEYREVGHDTAQMRAKALATLDAFSARGIFQKLSELANSRRAIRPPQNGELISWLLPEIAMSRLLVRANMARMHLAAETGNWREFTEASEQNLGLARVLFHQFTALDHAAGFAAVRLTVMAWRAELIGHPAPAECLDELQRVLDRQFDPPSPKLFTEGERLIGLDAIRFVYHDPDRSPIQMLELLAERPLSRDQMEEAVSTEDRCAAAFNDFYDRLGEVTVLPAPEALVRVKVLTESIAPPPTADRPLLFGIMIPAVNHAMALHFSTEAEVAATGLFLAIERFKATRGQLPIQLSELIPQFLNELPRDPYSTKGFCYRRRDGQEPASAARPYILYSAGPDGHDDGGVAAGDGLSLPTGDEAGSDILFVPPTVQ